MQLTLWESQSQGGSLDFHPEPPHVCDSSKTETDYDQEIARFLSILETLIASKEGASSATAHITDGCDLLSPVSSLRFNRKVKLPDGHYIVYSSNGLNEEVCANEADLRIRLNAHCENDGDKSLKTRFTLYVSMAVSQ